MAQNITYNISSVQNIANHNRDTTIDQTSQNTTVKRGDFDSLAQFLKAHGINESDLQHLKEILTTEPNLAEEKINNDKVQGWIGKIATKMAYGTMALATGLRSM